MKKKILSILLTGVLAAGSLAACGSTDSASGGESTATESAAAGESADAGEAQDVNLKIWVPEEEVDITDQMVKNFNALHDEFNMTWEIAVVGIDEAPQALETDADTAADIFYTPSGGVADLASKGLLLPITKDFDTISGDLPESALNAVTVDDLVYAVPFSPNTFFMYYNKDLYT